MQITRRQLQQIIREEILRESRKVHLPAELDPYIKALGRGRVQMSWVGNEGDLDSTIDDLAAAVHRRDIDKMASDLGVDLPTRDLD
jgi:hypothetical protein